MSNTQEKPTYKDEFESTKADEIAPLVGEHLMYTYANGWRYEVELTRSRTGPPSFICQ